MKGKFIVRRVGDNKKANFAYEFEDVIEASDFFSQYAQPPHFSDFDLYLIHIHDNGTEEIIREHAFKKE